jgi:DHA1 family inner membrane transport protein
VLSAGLGHTAPIWVGAALALLGTGIAVVARTADRHDRTAVCTSASADEAVPVESRTAA